MAKDKDNIIKLRPGETWPKRKRNNVVPMLPKGFYLVPKMPYPENSFTAYLRKLSREAAARHIIFCLFNGPAANEAWAIMDWAHGADWSCAREDLSDFVLAAVDMMKFHTPTGGGIA